MSIEIEKKYRLDALREPAIKERLRQLGAECAGTHFEENRIFPLDELTGQTAILRLRQVGKRTILTYKRRLASPSNIKHQIEFETDVADADSMLSILDAIGLAAVIVYEKRRETWRFDNAEIVFDELPFGRFIEIEGAETKIAQVEQLLFINDLTVEQRTYPQLSVDCGELRDGRYEARFSSR